MNSGRNNNVVIVVVGAMFCFVVAACVAVFIAVPEGANTSSLITILLGSFASTLTSIGVLLQVRGVAAHAAETSAKVDKVAEDTHALTNGLLDSKVRAGVAETIHPDLLHPEIGDTINEDRRVRQAAHDAEPDTRPQP